MIFCELFSKVMISSQFTQPPHQQGHHFIQIPPIPISIQFTYNLLSPKNHSITHISFHHPHNLFLFSFIHISQIPHTAFALTLALASNKICTSSVAPSLAAQWRGVYQHYVILILYHTIHKFLIMHTYKILVKLEIKISMKWIDGREEIICQTMHKK